MNKLKSLPKVIPLEIVKEMLASISNLKHKLEKMMTDYIRQKKPQTWLIESTVKGKPYSVTSLQNIFEKCHFHVCGCNHRSTTNSGYFKKISSFHRFGFYC